MFTPSADKLTQTAEGKFYLRRFFHCDRLRLLVSAFSRRGADVELAADLDHSIKGGEVRQVADADASFNVIVVIEEVDGVATVHQPLHYGIHVARLGLYLEIDDPVVVYFCAAGLSLLTCSLIVSLETLQKSRNLALEKDLSREGD